MCAGSGGVRSATRRIAITASAGRSRSTCFSHVRACCVQAQRSVGVCLDEARLEQRVDVRRERRALVEIRRRELEQQRQPLREHLHQLFEALALQPAGAEAGQERDRQVVPAQEMSQRTGEELESGVLEAVAVRGAHRSLRARARKPHLDEQLDDALRFRDRLRRESGAASARPAGTAARLRRTRRRAPA